MSPDPIQEPGEDSLSAPYLQLPEATNESDSEDDDIGMEGYMPLSDVPPYRDPILGDDEDDEWMAITDPHNLFALSPASNAQHECSLERTEVCSSPDNRSNIDMDADKINQVKSVMASFTLPTTAIPEWANVISEDQWKEQLIGRIKEMQNKDK